MLISNLELFMPVKVSTPCPMSWSEMEGSETHRHCASCDHEVQNYSLLDPTEREAMLARAKTQRVCAFGLSDAQGRLRSREELSQVALRWLRARTRAAGTVAALGLAVQPTSCESGDAAHGVMMAAMEKAEGPQAMPAETQLTPTQDVVSKVEKLEELGDRASLASEAEMTAQELEMLLTLGGYIDLE
jgi:hypothetical protein